MLIIELKQLGCPLLKNECCAAVLLALRTKMMDQRIISVYSMYESANFPTER